MSYEVLARKWRPQQFDEVVGQDHVVRTLKNAITSDRLAHAYLFVGPRGTGKTSMARIFAKALNCKEGPTLAPCDKCDSCREIAAGSSLDVLEIDGASNTGVEQVRELRDTVKYAPTHGTFKIYIIDEVHMLSQAAFNALLKTLEEPPPHVKFFFATTEPAKILPTILSRCQRFDLRRIPVSLIIERLELIAKEEKVNIDDDALLAIARGADGALRDAESALDQLISFKGADLSEEDVLSIFGLVSRSALDGMAAAVLDSNIEKLIREIARLDAAGKDMQRLVLELVEYFRNMLIILNVNNAGEDLDLTEGQIETLKQHADKTDTARVLRIIDILAETLSRVRYALSARIVVETGLIRCARAAKIASLEDILRKVKELRERFESGETVKKKSPVIPEPKAKPLPEKPKAGPKAGAKAKAEENPSASDSELEKADLAALCGRWREIVEKAARISIKVRSNLKDARPVRVLGETVTIGVDPQFAEEIEQLEATRNRKALEHVMGTVLKREVAVAFETMEGVFPAERPNVSADPGACREPLVAEPEAPEYNSVGLKNWAREPAVEKALGIFDGRIVDVRE